MKIMLRDWTITRTAMVLASFYFAFTGNLALNGQEPAAKNYLFSAKNERELVESLKSLQQTYATNIDAIKDKYGELYKQKINQLIATAPTLDDENRLIAELEEKKTKHPLLIDIYADENFQLIIRAISVERIRQAARDYASKNKYREAYAIVNNNAFWTHRKNYELNLYSLLRPGLTFHFKNDANPLEPVTSLTIKSRKDLELRASYSNERERIKHSDLVIKIGAMPDQFRIIGELLLADSAVDKSINLSDEINNLELSFQLKETGSPIEFLRSRDSRYEYIGNARERKALASVIAAGKPKPKETISHLDLENFSLALSGAALQDRRIAFAAEYIADIVGDIKLTAEFTQVDATFQNSAGVQLGPQLKLNDEYRSRIAEQVRKVVESAASTPGALILELDKQPAAIDRVLFNESTGQIIGVSGKRLFAADGRSGSTVNEKDEADALTVGLYSLDQGKTLLIVKEDGEIQLRDGITREINKSFDSTEVYAYEQDRLSNNSKQDANRTASDVIRLSAYDTTNEVLCTYHRSGPKILLWNARELKPIYCLDLTPAWPRLTKERIARKRASDWYAPAFFKDLKTFEYASEGFRGTLEEAIERGVVIAPDRIQDKQEYDINNIGSMDFDLSGKRLLLNNASLNSRSFVIDVGYGRLLDEFGSSIPPWIIKNFETKERHDMMGGRAKTAALPWFSKTSDEIFGQDREDIYSRKIGATEWGLRSGDTSPGFFWPSQTQGLAVTRKGYVIDGNSFERFFRLENIEEVLQHTHITSACFSCDNSRLALGFLNGTARVYLLGKRK